jgi:uncharacterized membrane protein (Fun14 family)
MPSWKRKLATASLVLGAVGGGTQLASSALESKTSPSANTTTVATTPAAPGASGGGASSAMPAGSSGFVAGGAPYSAKNQPPYPSAADPGTITAPPTTAPSQPPTLTQRISPWMTRLGISFFVALIIGLMFRTFLKIAAGITVVIGGIILALSYFHVLNIDMTQVKTEYASASGWIADQGTRLKDLVMHALPSSSAAAAGFMSGFKKK